MAIKQPIAQISEALASREVRMGPAASGSGTGDGGGEVARAVIVAGRGAAAETTTTATGAAAAAPGTTKGFLQAGQLICMPA